MPSTPSWAPSRRRSDAARRRRVLAGLLGLALLGPAGCGRPGAGGVPPPAVTAATFAQEVLESPVPVVVDFWAPWCGPCRRVAPAMAVLHAEFAGRVKVCKVNVDDEPELAGRYGIEAIPALLAFKGGEVVDERVGAAREQEYREWFQSLL